MPSRFSEYLTPLRQLIAGDIQSIEPWFADERFLLFMQQHKLAGFLYGSVKRAGMLEYLSEPERHSLAGVYDQQREKFDRLIREIHRLHAIFGDSEPEILWIKGPIFAQRFYDDPGLRRIADLDVVVKGDLEIPRIDCYLRKVSYQRTSNLPLGGYLARKVIHSLEYRNGRTKLDVHWAFRTHCSYRIDYASVWRKKQSLELSGVEVQTLCDKDALLLLLVSIFSDLQIGHIRQKVFVDVVMILRRIHDQIDWGSFLQEREQEGLLAITVNVLDLVLSILDCREAFDALAGSIDANYRLVSLIDIEDKIKLLDSRGRAFRNKLWAMPLYDDPLLQSLGWWVISLPVKLPVYGLRTSARLFRPS
jgi:hypothetical protein